MKLVDKLCEIVILQAELIKEQASLIERHQIIDDLEGKREALEDKLSEMALVDELCKERRRAKDGTKPNRAL